MAMFSAFAKCNGETVKVKAGSYTPVNLLHHYGLSEAEIPAVVTKVKDSWGGGKPPVYSYLIGRCECGKMHFVERYIERPAMASNHKCDGRCVNSKGRRCECSCGGKNHGAGY